MKLTTKGRYAVMAMADLALFKDKGPTSLTDIALRQNISLAYLEQIFIKLKSNNLVKSVRGAKGGYELDVSPEELRISNIIAVRAEIKITKTTAFSINSTNCSTCLFITTLPYQFVLIEGRYLSEKMVYCQKNRDERIKEKGEVLLKLDVYSNQSKFSLIEQMLPII